MSTAGVGGRLWSQFTAVRTARPPRPRVAIGLGPCVPAWALRLACAAVATGCALLVASDSAHWWIGGVLIVMMAVQPSSAAPSVFAVGIGLLVLSSRADPFHPRIFLLVLGLHLTVQLAAVVADLPWSALVELRVLTRFAGPFLAIQALAQTAAVLGAWMTTRQPSVTWLPIAAGAALAGLAWTILLRLQADSDRP